MPWTVDNAPKAMQHLSEKQKAKAVAIANAILREGGQEGIAIATGIKKAKELEKVAGFSEAALVAKKKFEKTLIKQNLMIPIATSTVAGALIGSTKNANSNTEKAYNAVKYGTASGLASGVLGYWGLKKHLKSLKNIIIHDKQIEARLNGLMKKASEDKYKDSKRAVGLGIATAGSAAFANKSRLIAFHKYVEVPDKKTGNITLDEFEPAIKQRMLKKLRLASLIAPFVATGVAYGSLKAKRKFYDKSGDTN